MLQADVIGDSLLQFATLTVIIMLLTEFLGKAIKWLRPVPQQTLAVIIGMLTGMLGKWLGWIDVGDLIGAKAYVGAAFLAMAATLVAMMGHDKIWNAILPSRVAEAYQKKKANGNGNGDAAGG